ncbi:response regulator [Caulobacter segnis]|uniref:response regulator n=1 Tax=Caulobacter segnis TaxID=88688 RepID=UPI0028546BE5|nr:response regulator [Caulobacter segnis]MDR6627132.1 two-component system response regulator AdeR [Caulobacter segnis]
MENALICVVEDDPNIARILRTYLEREHLRVVCAADGEAALAQHHSLNPALMLLDINIPKKDGYAVLAEVRRRGDTPVIFTTAMAEDIDRLTGLRMGADDYVVKPFNPAEVVARVKAVLRRTAGGARAELLRQGPIEANLTAHVARVILDEPPTVLNLTLSEFRILVRFLGAPMKVLSRAEILDACLPESDALERTVDSHVSNLRRKLDAAGATGFVINVRGVGYRLVAA